MIPDSNPTATSFIRLDGVTHSYQEAGNRHQVLRNIDLAIAGGEKVALLGRSGSGKSTLLNLVSGIDLPDSGTITLDGMVINTLDETRRTRFRRAQIGFIYQFFNLVPSLTAVENVALVLELNGITGQSARDQSIAMLARLGVAGKADSFPSRLSGGEQQRVAMARALVHAPGIVLADEPTGNLDARTGDQVLAVLHEVLGERGSALLMVTHSLAVARTADRIITLEEGVITEQAGDFAW
jgi:putative ABC transport system ATP-binding protein